MKTKPSLRRMPVLILLALYLGLSAAAHGAAYRFEMVIFERPNVATEGGSVNTAEPPDTSRAVGTLNGLAVGVRSLNGVAYTLKKKGMIVLEHIAWVQSPRGRNSEAWYSVGSGRLSGLIRVTRGRFLHVDADLYLRDANTAQPLHAKLYRRMRSGELHYLDHPKLGIMIRADRLRPRNKPDDDAATGEPKPAEPAGSQQAG